MVQGVTAVIPARSGSVAIPQKNIALIHGYPLLAYSIAAARQVDTITRVIVSTDSDIFAYVAKHYGAEVPVMRPPELATAESTDREWAVHLLTYLAREEGGIPEFIVHLRPTTPLRMPEVIVRAIDLLEHTDPATSLRSVSSLADPYEKLFRMDKGHFLHTLAGNHPDQQSNRARQEFTPTYRPDGYVDVLRTATILHGGFHGGDIYGFESPADFPVVEIDVPADLMVARKVVVDHPLLRWLGQRYPPVTADSTLMCKYPSPWGIEQRSG